MLIVHFFLKLKGVCIKKELIRNLSFTIIKKKKEDCESKVSDNPDFDNNKAKVKDINDFIV